MSHNAQSVTATLPTLAGAGILGVSFAGIGAGMTGASFPVEFQLTSAVVGMAIVGVIVRRSTRKPRE